MIELRHVRKEFSEATPLKDVNTVINQGDVISVIGPSGTGKSTLLRCINMLDPPTSGEIIVDGETITAEDCELSLVRRKLGMVFQSFNLFGHLTVIENLMVPQMDLLGRSKQEAFDKGMELLKRVGMAGRYLQYPSQLSGGQKQRVAIARTLTMDPEIILFDEPTSALDPTMVGEVESVIKELAKSGTTMMIVTHEMRFAREICNRVFYMDQGGIYEDGTPEEIFDNPKRDRTRQFIRNLKNLDIKIESNNFDFVGVKSAIESYCYQNSVSRYGSNNAKLVFDEIIHQLLMPRLMESGAKTKINYLLSYDPANESLEAIVRYGGESFDPRDSAKDALSLKLLDFAVSEIKHNVICEEDYTNRLELTIRLPK